MTLQLNFYSNFELINLKHLTHEFESSIIILELDHAKTPAVMKTNRSPKLVSFELHAHAES